MSEREQVEEAKERVLAVYPKAEAIRSKTYEHNMWYVFTPALGNQVGGRLSDYRLTEEGAWESAARHPYVASRLPAPVEQPEAGQEEPCENCGKFEKAHRNGLCFGDDFDPGTERFTKRQPAPQAEPSESAGDESAPHEAIDILTNVPYKPQVYPQAERVYCHLVKRMFDECGSLKAQEFIRRVQSGEHDVPSPWASQPSTQSQPSQAEGALEEAYEVGKVVGRVLTESQPSSLAGTFEEAWKEFQPKVTIGGPDSTWSYDCFKAGWNAARQQSQPVVGSYDDCSMVDAQAAEQYATAYVCEVGVSREAMIDAISTLRAQVMTYEAKSKQSQPVIEPLVEVVQKLVDTNFWHPFSLPLSRAQQDIINMANNALQQFRKAQKGLGK